MTFAFPRLLWSGLLRLVHEQGELQAYCAINLAGPPGLRLVNVVFTGAQWLNLGMAASGFDLSIAQNAALLGFPDGALPLSEAFVALDDSATGQQLSKGLAALPDRHDILRTRFVVAAGLRRPLQNADLAVGPVLEQASAGSLAQFLAERGSLAIDPSAGPLLRFVLLETPAGRWLAARALSAVADPASLKALLDELVGGPAEEDPLPFGDYLIWEQEQLAEDSAEARIGRSFWRPVVESAPLLPPRRRGASAVADSSSLPPALADASPEQWLTAFAIVLARRRADRAETAAISVAVTGRIDADLEHAIGPYERFVPLVIADDLSSDFVSMTARTIRTLDAAGRFSLYAPELDASAGFAHRRAGRAADGGPARFDIELEYRGAGPDAGPVVRHDPEAISTAEAARLWAELVTLLSAALADPAMPVDRLAMLPEAELALIRAALTPRPAAPADRPTAALTRVAEVAAVDPERQAVVGLGSSLPYGQLQQRAAAITASIVASGTRGPVGILLERSTDLAAAIVGVLDSGRPYVPLEPSHPVERLAGQLAVARVGVVLTSADLALRLPEDTRWVTIGSGSIPPGATSSAPLAEGAPSSGPRSEGAQSPPADSSGSDLASTAYLIFTSGSTGTPKAVQVSRANVAAYSDAVRRRLGLADKAALATLTSISTDLGNTAIFPALRTGGTLAILGDEAAADGRALQDAISEHAVDALKLTPSHLRALLAGGDVRLDVELLILGGEALDWDLVEQARTAGARRIVNHYGPTETTIGALTYEVLDIPADRARSVPIGTPLDHLRAHILDELGQPAPVGVVGELFLAGAGVADGYLGDPELTAARFVAEPGGNGALMYRTGDLVRLGDDGKVSFLGRADSQVKIRGFRVELGEIESVLRRHESIDEAAVVFDAVAGALANSSGSAVTGEPVLTAYVVASRPVDADAARSFVARSLPEHMVPLRIIALPALPRTPSGKLDRRALPDLEEPMAVEADKRAPANDTERELLDIWRQVLPGVSVGPDDNFFALGGHSLLATKVIARARAHFAVELPLHVIFASPTVAAMAVEIANRSAPDDDDEELTKLLGELEGMSEEEAARLLADPAPPSDPR
jgi:amino acid adenylation domain-containing protein